MHGGHPHHPRHIDCGIADRHDRIKGANLRGEAVEIDELIDFFVMNYALADELRGGPGYLNRFSASISGASAGVRLPCGLAAG